MILARALAEPETVLALDGDGWTGLLCAAHAERLTATLAHRVDGLPIPHDVASVFRNAQQNAEAGRTRALWEVEMARRALSSLGISVLLLKGSAFVAAGLEAGQGRLIGDLDILVPRDALGRVEQALLDADWEWLKTDAYDDHYYRTWMHELPPMIHRERDSMIDVHHTILPLTARPKPDAAALIAQSVEVASGLRMLCAEDMIVHAAAHLLADGDLSGGLRNLWDIRCLLDGVDLHRLRAHADRHGLGREVDRALRLSDALFGSRGASGIVDRLFIARLTARDGWGRETRKILRLAFYVRSHFIRMPFHLLVRHLWTKWRRR